MTTEVWRPVPGYEGAYEVSDCGRVRSLRRKDPLGRRVHGRILLASPNRSGYPRVTLRDGRKDNYRFVHRLVAESFLGPDDSRPFVNHKNGDKLDNRVENLEWCTIAENNQHAHDNNLVATVKGSRSNLSTLNERQVRVIARCLLHGLPRKWVAEQFGVQRPAIRAIAHKLTWKHVTGDILAKPIKSEIPAGEEHRRSKLSNMQVRVIARCVVLGIPYPYVGVAFGVSSKNVGYIARRQTWKHITSDIL